MADGTDAHNDHTQPGSDGPHAADAETQGVLDSVALTEGDADDEHVPANPDDDTSGEDSPAEPVTDDTARVDAPKGDEDQADASPADESTAETPDAEPTTVTPAEEPTVEAGPLTAVSLGLLPEVFVSSVSTQLMFYAPELPELPALPEIEESPEPVGSNPRRRSRNRRGGNDNRDDAEPAERSERPERAERPERQPRQRAVELITEPQRIKGSTRLEAKKQRRRDGREAGRRRAVVTEAEFLARREAVDRDMIVRSKNGRIQIAVLEDKVLVEHYVARAQEASLIGNVYLGRVQNVLPSMEAAFVDIGRGRNAVLYSGEVDWDAVETGNQPRRIELALKSGDRVLVQVTKDPVGHKGARLTSQISLPRAEDNFV